MSAESLELSVVIPVYNEAPNLQTLYGELIESMEGMGKTFEILFVDDGSRDESFSVLCDLQANDDRLRIVKLLRNFGQCPALYAGFEHVRGEVVIILDADLQNPPAEIPKLLLKLEEGYDIVQGWREMRKDNVLRKMASRLINKMVSWLVKADVNDLGSGIKAFRRPVVDRMCKARHHSRYIPAETAWHGFKIGEVKVAHRNRGAGDSKYSTLALLKINFDMIASISAAPVHMIGLFGGVFSSIGFLMAGYIGMKRVLYGNYSQLATVSALFFILVGVQMLCTSVMCEYISRIYVEVQDRPFYIVGEVVEKDE